MQLAHATVVSDPAVLGGAPVIRGTRIATRVLSDRIADGDTVDDILADYPHLDWDTVDAALLHAAAHPPHGRPAGKHTGRPPRPTSVRS